MSFECVRAACDSTLEMTATVNSIQNNTSMILNRLQANRDSTMQSLGSIRETAANNRRLVDSSSRNHVSLGPHTDLLVV